MTIEPDTKDWTWVLERPCPDCGLEAGGIARQDVPEMIRSNAVVWQDVLRTGPVRARPAPDVWSPLEYACHVRDVMTLFDERLTLMLEQDNPLFANWDQDATAVEERYGEQGPEAVADEVHDAAGTIATHFSQLTPDQWARTGRRTDGAAFTVESFSQYFLHDLVHHLHDVGRG